MKDLNDKNLYQEILKSDDQYPMVQIQIEGMNLRNKDREANAQKAIEIYSKVLKKKKTVHLYFYRQLNYQILHQYKNALEDYNEIIKLDKKFYGAYGSRADLYFKLGEFSKAIKDYTSHLRLIDDYSSYLLRGEAYFYLNKFDLAMEDFKAAIVSKTKFDEEFRLGQIKLKKDVKKFEKEVKLAEKLKSKLKKNPILKKQKH